MNVYLFMKVLSHFHQPYLQNFLYLKKRKSVFSVFFQLIQYKSKIKSS